MHSIAWSQSDSTAFYIKQLSQQNNNSNKAQACARLVEIYMTKNIDSAKIYLTKAQQLFPTKNIYQNKEDNKLKIKIQMAEADLLIKFGKLTEAEKKYYDLLTLNNNYLDKTQRANILVQMGVANDYMSNSVNALRYYNSAYKIYDSLDNKKGTSECLNNMGVIYYKQDEKQKAIEYLEKSLAIRRTILVSRSAMADLIENLGTIYLMTGKYESAEKYYNEGLQFYRSENNSWGIAYALKNLAKYNIKTKHYDEALEQCNDILKNHSGANDSSGISMINSIIAEIYFHKNDYKKSIEHGLFAYKIAAKMDVASRVYESSKILKQAFEADKNYKEAFKFLTIYILMKDSLSDNSTEKESIKLRMEHEKEIERVLFEKEREFAELEKKRKNLILIFISTGLIIILFFSGLLFKKFKETKKQKQIIEEKAAEVSAKQKEILDSIHYAKRIQTALLPNEKYVERNLNELNKN